jgi:N-acetylglucosaminyl-diphospho-decaprenol L-rhamnosyltransferase
VDEPASSFAAIKETMRRCAATLRDADVPYALGGSVAAWARGGPPTSRDLDFVLLPTDALCAQAALERAGLRGERPPEDWLLKAYDGEVLVDLIFALSGVDMPVLVLEDVLTAKLLAFNDHDVDFSGVLQIVRALREQIDWPALAATTAGSPYARAFLSLVRELGLSRPGRRPGGGAHRRRRHGRPLRRPLRCAVVIATRDRCATLLRTLARLADLAPAPTVVVVDNGSRDGSVAAVRAAFPAVRVIEAGANLGAAARTLGAAEVLEPLVAFSDDDSWWAAGALERAAGHFAAHPRLGLLGARILVGPDQRLDPTCTLMADSPLGAVAGVGPRILGFVACGTIVRRDAFLRAGGFHRAFGVGGEEQLLAVDLAAAGWELAYADDVVAHHHPSSDPRLGRGRREIRNELWMAWLRRRPTHAARTTARLALRSPAALAQALRGAHWVAHERRRLPATVEGALDALDDQRAA